MGIEVTFMPGGFEQEDMALFRHNTAFSDMARAMSMIFNTRLSKQHPVAKKLTHNCGTDPEVIEISTAPVSTRRLLDKVLSAYYTVAGSMGLVTSYDWHGGGGAHIHVGRTRKEHADMDCAVAMFATHHPYMTWAFMNPGDSNNNAKIHCALAKRTINVDEILSDMAYVRKERNKCIKRGIMADAKYYQKRVNMHLKTLLVHKHSRESTAKQVYGSRPDSFGKGAAIARRSVGKFGTWEFRLFRAPDTMEGHTRQLNFALAYIQYCEQLARSGKIPKPYLATLDEAHKAHPFPVAVAKFNKLLRTLGLDARKYRADVENMRRYYLINKLDMGTATATTTEEVYVKPITVRLPRSVFYRKHKRGVMPEGVPFKVSRATRRAAKAERKAREEYIKTHGLRRSDLRLKLGDTVTHMDGAHTLTTTVTHLDHADETQPFRLGNGFWVTRTGRTNFHTDPNRDTYRILSVNGLTIIED